MINYLGDLKRSFDHAKIAGGDNEEEYQAAMVIRKDNVLGKSFWITRDAIWKYVEPKENADPKTMQADIAEFNDIVHRNQFARKMAVTIMDKGRATLDAECITFAVALNMGTGIMLCTGYNLAKCMQMLNIRKKGLLCPEAAAQLLMWIQDGLDQLKDMPDALPDSNMSMGEVTIFDGSTKLGTKEITVPESDMVIESNEE